MFIVSKARCQSGSDTRVAFMAIGVIAIGHIGQVLDSLQTTADLFKKERSERFW